MVCMCFIFLFLILLSPCIMFFFFNDTATTEIYTLSLHDALPIYLNLSSKNGKIQSNMLTQYIVWLKSLSHDFLDRKSTRLNSSHQIISYAVFCLKKKKLLHPRVPSSVTAMPRLPNIIAQQLANTS